MRFLAIILLIVFGYALDLINKLLTSLGIPFFIANIVPVIILGWVFEMFDVHYRTRSTLGKWFRVIVFGALASFILLGPIPWILRIVLMFVLVVIADATS